MEYVDKKNEWIESERKNGSRKKLRKTNGLSGSKAQHSGSNRTAQTTESAQHRFGGCPGVSENHH